MAVEASHNKTKTHTNKLWSKNYEYGFNKFKLFVTLINKNNTFFFSQTISKSCLPSLVFIYFSKVVYLLLYLFICQELSTSSCIYLFLKSCLPSLEFIYLPSCLPSPVFFFICHELSTFSCIFKFYLFGSFY